MGDEPAAALCGDRVEVPDHVGGPHAAHEALLGKGVLPFQVCLACSSAVFPARSRCSGCGADALVWRASAGRGQVYSATSIAPRDEGAYTVVLVDLDEGFRMMSRVDGGRVAIGERVRADLVRAGDGVLPFFVVEEAGR